MFYYYVGGAKLSNTLTNEVTQRGYTVVIYIKYFLKKEFKNYMGILT